MRVAGLTMIMAVLAFKSLRFNGLALFRLPGRGVLRIVYCVAFCCVIQVISLSSAAGAADEKQENGGFPARTPNNQFKRRCGRGQMGGGQTLPLITLMTLIYTDRGWERQKSSHGMAPIRVEIAVVARDRRNRT